MRYYTICEQRYNKKNTKVQPCCDKSRYKDLDHAISEMIELVQVYARAYNIKDYHYNPQKRECYIEILDKDIIMKWRIKTEYVM